MTPLDILRRSFRTIGSSARTSGVYLLSVGDRVIYCGASRTNVLSRVGQHSLDIEFDDALWYPLPAAVVFDYEGAFTRALDPELNENAPPCRGHDNEILEGFGLEPHADPEAVARRWHLKRYGKQMVPWPKRRLNDFRRMRAKGS